MILFNMDTYRRGNLASKCLLTAYALVCLCSSRWSGSEAFEKWERPLGWNPQYGPRYVVFSGGPAGYKDPPLGTCTYDHYTTTPVVTNPPLAPFEDFHIAKLYEDAQPEVTSPLMTDAELAKVGNMPFYESSPVVRYRALREIDLPFSDIQNIHTLLKAAKTIALQICSDLLQRVNEIGGEPSAALAVNLEAEVARVYVVVLAVYDALAKGLEAPSKQRDSRVCEILGKAFKSLRSQKVWDSNIYAYWLDVSSQSTEDGRPYYIPDLESTLWQYSMRALASIPLGPDSPYMQLVATGDVYKDCIHFVQSSRPNIISGKERLCEDSFFAVTTVLESVGERVAAIASPRGKQLLTKATQRLQRHIVDMAKAIKPESPFYHRASEILKSQGSK